MSTRSARGCSALRGGLRTRRVRGLLRGERPEPTRGQGGEALPMPSREGPPSLPPSRGRAPSAARQLRDGAPAQEGWGRRLGRAASQPRARRGLGHSLIAVLDGGSRLAPNVHAAARRAHPDRRPLRSPASAWPDRFQGLAVIFDGNDLARRRVGHARLQAAKARFNELHPPSQRFDFLVCRLKARVKGKPAASQVHERLFARRQTRLFGRRGVLADARRRIPVRAGWTRVSFRCGHGPQGTS